MWRIFCVSWLGPGISRSPSVSARTNYGAIARPYRPLLETPGCKCAKTIHCRHLGSLNGDEDGGWEIYRASKAALNMYMRRYAARHKANSRTLLPVSPGWVKTDMGSSNAPLDVQTSSRGMVDVILSRSGQPGLLYVDHRNRQIGG
jgi:NAD(P)-dependent dehydrogenase (short-subunit alcohol dehydrogenase family)